MGNNSDKANSTRSNVPEYSVSEISYALKRTLEDTYGHVRVRGELSRVKIHSSGHMYSDLKDDKTTLSVVCWRGTVSRLKVKPEEGLEVICTGRISSYPARSSYQLIIETMELAGEGALLKLLEERRKKLAAEGLFKEERKKKLPFLPDLIGVVTSPTGAVIRDIMHRLDDRFPRPVLLWPALVQGEGAAEQIAAAIKGFNALPIDGPVKRPDVLIVGRGGGSLEDLMPFNEEIVVRAIAESNIPVISAVGHETDTTLADYAADLRAPTPTAAAEMAVPRRLDIWNGIQECLSRISRHSDRKIELAADRLENYTARLGDPLRLLEMHDQKLDHLSEKLARNFERKIEAGQALTERLGGRLISPEQMVRLREKETAHEFQQLKNGFDNVLTRLDHTLQRLDIRPPSRLADQREESLRYISAPLSRLTENIQEAKTKELKNTARMLETLSFKKILKRGFVVVRDEAGAIITKAGQTHTDQILALQFQEDQTVAAKVTGGVKGAAAKEKAPSGKNPRKKTKNQSPPPDVHQEELF